MAHPGPHGQQREEACPEHEKQCVNILQEQYMTSAHNIDLFKESVRRGQIRGNGALLLAISDLDC